VPERGPRAAIAFALATLALALLLTPAALGRGDAAELTLALALAGVPHPTGYPLYVLAGSPFVNALHAAGVSWVRAAAAFSALGAALAAGLLVALGGRLRARAAAREAAPRASLAFALPAALLVLNPVWLEAATMAEVYTWWYAWVALAALLALANLRAIESRGEPPSGRAALAWGLLCGAGLLQHAASVCFVVPLTIALAWAAWRARAARPAHAAGFALGFVVALGADALIAWRAWHPARYQWPLDPSLHAVLSHVSAAAYRAYLGGFAPGPEDRARLAGAILPLLVPGLVVTTVCALRCGERALRAALLALLAGAGLLIAFLLAYRVPDPAMTFVPALMIALLGAAPAFAALERRVPRAAAAALLLAALAVAGATSVRAARAENRARENAEARIRRAWERIPYERAIVLWWDDDCTRLKLYQLLGGEKPGLYVESPNRLTWPAVRRDFERRFGFDPFEGFAVRRPEDVGRLPDHLRGRAPLPVLDFVSVLDWGPAP
jgi:hypothetical protein